eukprot:Skav219583  [mRNA]  locus=scaffold249:243095:244090:+ [translate_table: standard]
MRKPARVWCDNSLVVQRCHQIQQGTLHLTRMMPDHDLWSRLQECILLCPCPVEVIKVASHQEVTTADDLHAWAFAGNDNADAAAKQALRTLPPQVLSLQQKVADETRHLCYVQGHLHKHFARVGTFAVNNPDKPADEEVPRNPLMLGADDIVVDFALIARVAHNCDRRMQFDGFGKFVSWMNWVADDTAGCEVQWVTWYELLYSFQMGTSMRSVTKVHSQQKWKQTDMKSNYRVLPECHAFAAFVSLFIRMVYPTWAVSHVKPSFHKFQKWAMCLAVRWNSLDAERVHDWLRTELRDKQIVGIEKDLGQLPMAYTDAAAVPSTAGLFQYFR